MELIKKVIRNVIIPFPIKFYRYFIRRNIIYLYYHIVSNEVIPTVNHLYSYKSEEIFEKDLIFIKNNYKAISYDEISLQTNAKIPSVLLSFDDGFSQCYSVVRPLLLKYDIPCIFFISSDYIDNKMMMHRNIVSLCIEHFKNLQKQEQKKIFKKMSQNLETSFKNNKGCIEWIDKRASADDIKVVTRLLNIHIDKYLKEHTPYLTTQQIKELANDGFTIGAHSQSHLKLQELSNEDVEREIVISCEKIMEITGKNKVPFSFPFYGKELDKNFLKSLQHKYPFIDSYFDIDGVKMDPLFVHRIFADRKPRILRNRSNLPFLIKQAYQGCFLKNMLNIFLK